MENIADKPFFSKRTTNIIKGLMLILMFVHHFFTFPSWYIDSISYPELSKFAYYFCGPTQICVPVFAFITGYLYYFNKQKNIQYSIIKIIQIFINYWFVYLVFYIISITLSTTLFSIKNFILEFISIRCEIMIFCWYVSFYSISMLVLPFLTRITLKINKIWLLIISLILFSIILKIVHLLLSSTVLCDISSYIANWFPFMLVGIVVAKYKIFENIFDNLIYVKLKKYIRIIILIIIIIIAIGIRYFGISIVNIMIIVMNQKGYINFSIDILTIPCFVYALCKVIFIVKKNNFINNNILVVLEEIGKKSLLMWFLHCIFFSPVTKEIFQPLLYFLHKPILVLIWGLMVTYIVAIFLSKISKIIFSKIIFLVSVK